MLKKILIGVVILIAGLVVLGLTQPSDYVISRSATVKAPIEKIWPYLVNSKLAEQWGPWTEVDPNAKMNYEGPVEGVGAKTWWESTGQLGTGSATIAEIEPNKRVRIALAYTKPFPMNQTSDYIVEAKGEETTVTWRVEGKNSFPGRIMCVFMNMDKTVGGFFELGLGKLKALVEKAG